MSINKRDAYEIVCDEPGCGKTTFDVNGEFSMWGDQGAAIDDWTDADGQWDSEHEQAWCHEHSKPICADCGLFRPTNDDDECAECARAGAEQPR